MKLPAEDRHAIDRLGTAILAPTRALAASGWPGGAGRAPADLAVLVLVGFAATHLIPLVRAIWLVVGGNAMGGVHILLRELSDWLRAPLACAVGGGIVVTILAGRRRSIGADFDLACIASIPLATTAVLAQLLYRVDWFDPFLIERAALIGGAVWSGLLMLLAIREARRRWENK